MSKTKYVMANPLDCLGERKKAKTLRELHDDVVMQLSVDMAISTDGLLQHTEGISRRVLGNFAFNLGASDMSAEAKSATLIGMLQCSGVCQPHRPEVLRKHVDSREVEAKLLT